MRDFRNWAARNLAIIMIMLVGLMSVSAMLTYRNSVTNKSTLKLVKQCVVDGKCGTDAQRSANAAAIQRIIDGLDCLAGPATIAEYRQCVIDKVTK